MLPSSTPELSNTKLFILIGVVLIAGSLVIGFFDIKNDLRVKQELNANGQLTTANVTNVSVHERKKRKTYTVNYEFAVPGSPEKIYRGTTSGSGHYVGQRMDVVYSSRQPDIFLLKNDYDRDPYFDLNHIFYLGAFVFGVVIATPKIVVYPKAQRLDREGQICRGVIEQTWEEQRSRPKGGSSTVYFVRYGFDVLGTHYSLKEQVNKEYYMSTSEGSEVQVKYLQDNPEVARIHFSRVSGLTAAADRG